MIVTLMDFFFKMTILLRSLSKSTSCAR